MGASAVLAGGLAAGVVLAGLAPWGAAAWWLAGAALAGAAALRRWGPGRGLAWLGAAAAVAGALLGHGERLRWAGDLGQWAGQWVCLAGTVAGEGDGLRPPAAVVAARRPGRGRVLVTAAGAGRWDYGDLVEACGRLRLPRGRWEEGWARRRGAAWVLEARWTARRGGGGGLPPVALALELRRRVGEVFAATLTPEAAGLLQALVLGDRSHTAGLAADFRRTGLTHVLSVSGLHVGFVAGAVAALLAPAGLGPRGRAAVLAPVLVLYVLVTGAAAPVVRAALMLGAALAGRCLGRPGGGVRGLTAAFTIMVAARPSWLFDPGFQLSFAATAGIILWAPALAARGRGWPRPLAQGLAVTLAAQAATLPLTLHYFGSLSLVAPVANLAVVPLVGLAVPLGCAAGLAGLAALPAAWALNRVNEVLLSLALALVRWFAAWPGAGLDLPRLPAWGAGLAYAGMAVAAGARRWRAGPGRAPAPGDTMGCGGGDDGWTRCWRRSPPGGRRPST